LSLAVAGTAPTINGGDEILVDMDQSDFVDGGDDRFGSTEINLDFS
jgi:hypothetical protein